MAVHEFAADASASLYSDCDPDGPVPPITTAVAAVRLLWCDGHADDVGPAQLPYLHPILARLQPPWWGPPRRRRSRRHTHAGEVTR